MAALVQSTRLEVFRLLMRWEPDGVAAGDIARELAVPPNTLSAHLSVLTRAGLVRSERRSRSIIYRADLRRSLLAGGGEAALSGLLRVLQPVALMSLLATVVGG